MKNINIILLSSIILFFNNCSTNECSDEYINSQLKKIDTFKTESASESLQIIDSLINYCDYKTAKIYHDKASILYNIKDWVGASTAYTKALNLGYQKDDIIYYNRSICYANSNIGELAWKDYQNYKQIYPNDSIPLIYLRYLIFVGLQEQEKALLILDTMVTNQPEDMMLYSEMASLKLELHDTAGYCEALNKAVQLGLAEKYNLSEEELLQLCN